MAQNIIRDDLHVAGNLSCESFRPPAGSIDAAAIEADAGIPSSKLEHRFQPGTNFATAIGGTPATREEIVFVAQQACTLNEFKARLADTGTSTNITFDLKKNGASILTGAVSFTHADTDGTIKTGTLSSTTLVADDVLSILMTVTSATGAVGPFAWIELDQDAQ